MIRIGASAGLTLRYVGLCGRLAGSWLRAALIAAWTSRAAASMLRLRSNCNMMLVAPSELVEVISVNTRDPSKLALQRRGHRRRHRLRTRARQARLHLDRGKFHLRQG